MADTAAERLTRAAEELHAHTVAQGVWETIVRAALELLAGARAGATGATGVVATFVLEERAHAVISLEVSCAESAPLDDEAQALADLLARQATLALVHVRRQQNLPAALESRTRIGIALGLVMERLGLDDDAAFAYLTRLSETREQKVRDVAATIVADYVTALPERTGRPTS